MLLEKKDKDEQVLLAKDQAWMESSSDLDQEINANMVFMAKIKKVLSDSETSSSSVDDKISEDLKDKYDILKNQATTFEMKNKELNEQLKVLIEKNDDLIAQTKVLKDQIQVKHVVMDTHVECQEKYAKLEAERYEYMIRYSAYFDNERLEDAYFDASTSFHEPSNIHTFYQPYPHEKKWTKDHPLHKIIGDPKSSVRIRGQLANSCLFSCLLSFIEPANVAEALRDADLVSAMQEELDQFSRLKVWRLVSQSEGKTIIKTKWIFKNKKDESSLVIQNKARLVVVGYSQQEGIAYDETTKPELKEKKVYASVHLSLKKKRSLL
nr:hypothetical protein [Tanacetum cinerariifolium]